MRNKDVLRIVLTALFIALVTAFTFINVPFPGAAGGLMHLGTLMGLIIAILFGKHYGAIASGFGMGIFDVLGGWMLWAPGTFVVRLLMGYVVGLLAYDKQKGQGGHLVKNIIALFGGLIVMVVGYYFYEGIFLTDLNAAFLSIPGNLIQFALGALSIPIAFALRKALKQANLDI